MLAHRATTPAPGVRVARAAFALCPRTGTARRRVGALVCRAEADYPPGPSRLATTVSTGLAMMINSAFFAAAYESLPHLQILASRVEELEPRPLYLCMVKLGTLLASPVDLLLLTIALVLIELMRLMSDDE